MSVRRTGSDPLADHLDWARNPHCLGNRKSGAMESQSITTGISLGACGCHPTWAGRGAGCHGSGRSASDAVWWRPPAPGTPAPPSPSTPVVVESVPLSREAQLEERVRQLEAMVNQLSTQMQPAARLAADPASCCRTRPGSHGPVEHPVDHALPSRSGGVAAPGQSLPPNPPPSDRFDSPATLESKKGNFRFGPGFEFRTDDDEYILQFHNLTQFEYRGYQQYGQTSVHDSFLIPRQWLMFSGRITKPFGYFVSFANGFDTFCLLDVFLDFNIDPRFAIRAGRFKTPFTYEFMVEPIQGLILPERSLFFNNFGQNRDLGVMPYGRLFNNTFDYAARHLQRQSQRLRRVRRYEVLLRLHQLQAVHQHRRAPFSRTSTSAARSSRATSNIVPIPAILRTIVPTTGNAVAGVPFLGFNSNVRQSGPLAFWDLHTAWYYGGLALIAEWQSGFQDYAQTSNLAAERTCRFRASTSRPATCSRERPAAAWASSSRRHPFSLKAGQFGLGAWELTGRYNFMDIGSQVFTNGLADPEPLGQPALHHRPRVQLAHQPVPQVLLRLGARGVQPAGDLSPRTSPGDQRSVPGANPALLLIGMHPHSARRHGREGTANSSKPLLDPLPRLVPVGSIEVADLGLGEDRPRQAGHPGFPLSVADDCTTLDLPGMADVELDLVPEGPQFDAVKIGHFHQTANAAVVRDQFLQHGHEPLVVLVQDLAADPHAEDLSRTLIQGLDHGSILP